MAHGTLAHHPAAVVRELGLRDGAVGSGVHPNEGGLPELRQEQRPEGRGRVEGGADRGGVAHPEEDLPLLELAVPVAVHHAKDPPDDGALALALTGPGPLVALGRDPALGHLAALHVGDARRCTGLLLLLLLHQRGGEP